MRWLAIAVSPLVRTGDTILPRSYSRAVLGKRMRASMACLATETGGSTVDVERIRRDMVWDAAPTPVAHFNSAGDSPMPLKVLERVQTHMQMEATLGGYEAAANVQEELEAVYSSAAQLINAKPEEIALQVNAHVYVPRMYVSMSPSPGGSLLHTSHLTYIEENTCSASFVFLVTCTHQFGITHTRCRVTIRVVEYQTLVRLKITSCCLVGVCV